MLGVLVGFATASVIWSLWTRRHAWQCRWETASTLNVTLLGVGGLLLNRSTGDWVMRSLRFLTHQTNLRYHVAMIFLLLATSAGIHSAVSKLMDERGFAWWMRSRVQIPVAVSVVILTALFVASSAGASPNPLLVSPLTDRFLAAYWAYVSALMIYLLWNAMLAYIDLWHDDQSRPLVYPHIIAAVLMGISMVIRLVSCIFWNLQPDVMPVALCFGYSAVVLYATGAAFCWISRVGSLTGRATWTGSTSWPRTPTKSK